MSKSISNERLVTDFEKHFWNPMKGKLFIGFQKNMLSVKLIQIYSQYTKDEVFLIGYKIYHMLLRYTDFIIYIHSLYLLQNIEC
ncbi:hypothetical protein MC28_E130 (plasmid) [Bacillus thuringiensis MC28]|nr:hypothetical protein MC28_E130 [Bacillus thuringiensis MC28]